MRFEVGTLALEDSNAFLRALWAELRRRCGRCGWNYAPLKVGERQRIFVGQADIDHPTGVMEVWILYGKRGSIGEIEFVPQGNPQPDDAGLRGVLSDAVQAAKDRKDMPERGMLAASVESLLASFGHYKGENFSIVPSGTTTFSLRTATHGFDHHDRQSQATELLPKMLDVLSVETNSFFVLSGGAETFECEAAANTHYSSKDFFEGLSTANGHLAISQDAHQLLDIIGEPGSLQDQYATYLSACYHFHTARRLDAQRYDRVVLGAPVELAHEVLMPLEQRDQRLNVAASFGSSQDELAASLYVSALEVAASIGSTAAATCRTCNQPVYSISRRVSDLVQSIAGEATAKEVKRFYGGRSKYLHAGIPVSRLLCEGPQIPQLDNGTASGCVEIFSIPIPKLRELTSYCLRTVLRRMLAGDRASVSGEPAMSDPDTTKPQPLWHQQSPIDLSLDSSSPVVVPIDHLVLRYPNERLEGEFRDHDFWFDQPPTLSWAGRSAKLERIHIHSKSEHLLEGVQSDFEIHFVNVLDDQSGDSKVVVLGVFFRESIAATTPKSILELNKAIGTSIASDAKNACEKVRTTINPYDFLPANLGQHFRYEGSLTTPDYDEFVSWVVFPDEVHVAPGDVQELKKCAHHSARPCQPLNRRFVLRNF